MPEHLRHAVTTAAAMGKVYAPEIPPSMLFITAGHSYNAGMSEGTHSYYDWQVSTLMLAYDVVQPLRRDDDQRQNERQQDVEKELQEMVNRVIPEEYRRNPEKEFPPKVVMLLTRAVLERSARIVGLLPAANTQAQ